MLIVDVLIDILIFDVFIVIWYELTCFPQVNPSKPMYSSTNK